MKRRRRTEDPDGAGDYWVSYSDLMAGLLMVFILLLFLVLRINQLDLEQREQVLDQRQQELELAQQELEHARYELDDLRSNVAALLGVRAALIRRLTQRFDEVGGEISFDDATGAVRLGSDILFEEGEHELTGRGRAALRQFVPLYVEALLGDPTLRTAVDRITFEGHTNSNYNGGLEDGFIYNLELSQLRAQAAASFVVEEELVPFGDAREFLSAVGYSSSRPILTDGREDLELSRRLEIRFRLKDEESLDQLRTLLESGSLTGESAP